MKKIFQRIFNFLSSLKLAVILILSLGAILATGTFYEAEYGTPDAQRVIYHSWFLSAEMFLLIINLACAAIDRYPWKKHHIGFVVTHAGIITLLIGSFITQRKGIDGTLALGINEASDNFMVEDTELHIYQNIDGKPFFILAREPVDFDRKPPETHKYDFKLADNDILHVVHYIEKATRKIVVVPTTSNENTAAVKFTLYNDRVNVSEWLALDGQIPPYYDLGPALITFIKGELPKQPQPRNQIAIYEEPKKEVLKYAIFSIRQRSKPVARDSVVVKKEYPTGWMGLKFRVDEFYPHAVAQAQYEPADPKEINPDNTVHAIQVELHGKTEWLELQNSKEIKGDKSSYFVSYTRKKYELGFGIALKKFKMGVYGGSGLPMSYESTVMVNNRQETVISMNEPLKFNGYTLYQSSFEQNERGEPISSVFAVNYDPGRPVKYLGAICIVCGIGIMFYLKPRWSRVKKV